MRTRMQQPTQVRAWSLWACLCLAAIGCQSGEEHALLLRVFNAEATPSLDIYVRALDGTFEMLSTTVTTQAEPLRLAVEFRDRHSVMIHIEGTPSDGIGLLVATRCYDVNGILRDDLFITTLAMDGDGDGFSTDPSESCLAPAGDGTMPCTAHQCEDSAVDCNDADSATGPLASESCGEDRNCDGIPGLCPDNDGDGWVICPPGLESPRCDCDDDNSNVHPSAEEQCGDGVDQTCDGVDELCDRDGDGSPADRELGGYPDCDDTDPAIHPGATEVCTEAGGIPRDEDCVGGADNLGCTPDDLDRDGFVDCSVGVPPCDCNDCDPGIHPDAEDACGNGIDEDCTGDDAPCSLNDADGDGFASTASGGTDCDDRLGNIFPGAIEICDNGIAEGCVADASCTEDADSDSFVEPPECEDGSRDIRPDNDELCDGFDNNCNGVTDEVLASGHGCVFDASIPGCGSSPCTVNFGSEAEHCGGCRVSCNDTTRTADDCIDGVCMCTTSRGGGTMAGPPCAEGSTCCALEDPAGRGCKNLGGDMLNCGACGHVCNPGLVSVADACVDGSCACGPEPACSAGQVCCSGSCAYFDTDVNNCGACGVHCGPGEACEAGHCRCGALVSNPGGGAVCASNKDCCTKSGTTSCRSPSSC